jgi:hypothetical protein
MVTGEIIRDVFKLELVKAPEVLTEDSNGKKRKYTRLTSLVQKSDFRNENGRYYPYRIMKEAVNSIQEQVKSRMILGELDHPADAKVHTEDACLLLTKLWMENKNVYAEFEILEDLPKGKILKSLIDNDVTVSISSRGVGDMEPFIMEDGSEVDKILPGFRFVCFDAVMDPSVSGTSLSVTESRQIATRKKKFKSDLISAVKEYLV